MANRLVVLAVRDVRLGEFLPPFVAPNGAVGERMFVDALGDSNSPFVKHPDDYALYELGVWDSETGVFEHSGDPKILRFARDYLKVVDNA